MRDVENCAWQTRAPSRPPQVTHSGGVVITTIPRANNIAAPTLASWGDYGAANNIYKKSRLYPEKTNRDSLRFIGYESLTFPPQIFVTNSSYEWEMNNFSNPGSFLPEKEEEDQDKGDKEKSVCEWDFTLSAVISSGDSPGTTCSDTLGVVEIDPSDRILATGGISRKIRIYSAAALLTGYDDRQVSLLDHATACDFYICTPAKLSSLRWKPGSAGAVLGSADYDGVIMEYDLEKRLPVFERDEHGGRRVWSMDYSPPGGPVIGASGSDDGTMQMWDPRCDGGECLAVVQPTVGKSPVCCVEFNPFRGELIAVGCADSRVYGYDVRRMADPVLVLSGHRKAVTYTRFLDQNTIVTSGIDGSLKTWSAGDGRVIRTYSGHVNTRRFVGLSVWRAGGLLCCGSEDNQVVVYDKRWANPIWVRGFEPSFSGESISDRGFVSSVCWRQLGDDQCSLVAGGSDGVLQIFKGTRLRR